MATLKQLLITYKIINKDFRHEFDGETWNIWLSKGVEDAGYPTYANINADKLKELLIHHLKEYDVMCKERCKYWKEQEDWVNEVLAK